MTTHDSLESPAVGFSANVPMCKSGRGMRAFGKLYTSSGQSLGTRGFTLRDARQVSYTNSVKNRFGFVCSLAGAAATEAVFGF